MSLFWRAWEAATPFFAVVGLVAVCSLVGGVALAVWADVRYGRDRREAQRGPHGPLPEDADRDLELLLADRLPPAPAGLER